MGSFLAGREKPTGVDTWTNFWSPKDRISWPSLTSDPDVQIMVLTDHTGYWDNRIVIGIISSAIKKGSGGRGK